MNDGPVINGHSAIGDSPNVAPTVNIVNGQTTKAWTTRSTAPRKF